MSKLMKSEKGASSILVILLLVVLVVFGVAALTTALSNVRLGQKVHDWNEKYYAAEATANEVYAEIDKAVYNGYVEMGHSSPDKVSESVAQLDLGIEIEESENSYRFSYEVWEENVGIEVVLRFDIETMTFSVAQWQEMQRQQ